jgi:hypothetical protein
MEQIQLFSNSISQNTDLESTDSEETVAIPVSPVRANLFPNSPAKRVGKIKVTDPKIVLHQPVKIQNANDKRRKGSSRLDWILSWTLLQSMLHTLYLAWFCLFDIGSTVKVLLQLTWTLCWAIVERIKTFPTGSTTTVQSVSTLAWRSRFNLKNNRECRALYTHLTTHLDKLPSHLSVVLPEQNIAANVVALVKIALLCRKSSTPNNGITLLSVYCSDTLALDKVAVEMEKTSFETINRITQATVTLSNVLSLPARTIQLGQGIMTLNVVFMSYENASKPFMARQVSQKGTKNLDNLFINDLGITEPDFCLVFPRKAPTRQCMLESAGHLQGYPPWLLRVAEIFFITPRQVWINNKVDGILALLGSSVGKRRRLGFWEGYVDESCVAGALIHSLRRFAKVERRFGT